MEWFQEVKPFFLVTRAYGLAPYSYNTGLPSESLPWRIYAYISLVARVSDTIARPFVLNKFNGSEWNFIFITMIMLRSMLTGCCFIIEGYVCTRTFPQLKIMIDLIADYDRTLRIDFATKSLAIKSWLIIGVSAVYFGFRWTLYSSSNSIFYQMLDWYYLIRNFGMFAMVFKFVAVVNSIERRFRHLCNLITADTTSILYDIDGSPRPLRLNDVCRLHGNLVKAAKTFNSMHNMVLLIWITETAFHATTSIYALMTNPDLTESRIALIIILHIIPDVTILVYLIDCCHSTSDVANRIGYTALSPKSCVLRGRYRYEREEGYLIGQHFILNSLQFTAAYGLINIELPFLSTIMGAMTTLLVILTD